MTESEIMKVLECCVQYQTTDVRTYKGIPLEVFSKAVVDLINLKNAKIAKLNFENLQMVASIKGLKAEAIKEFAERVKNKSKKRVSDSYGARVFIQDIDNLVKEMGCGE